MGAVVIDSRDRNRELVDSLYSWMDRRRQDRATNTENERVQAENERRARIGAAQAQLQQIHPSQRSAFLAQLPEDIRGIFTDPSNLPPPQLSDREQLSGRIGKHMNETYDPAKPFAPDPVALGFIEPDLVGKAPFMDAATQRYNYGNAGALPPEVGEAQAVADKIRMSAEEQAKADQAKLEYDTIKLPESRVGVVKTKAETGKIGAETTKVREETTTERELRDPNSPASTAKAQAGGRKNAAQQAVEGYNIRLRELDKARAAIVIEIEGEKAASSGKGATPFLKKKEAELRATDALMKDAMDKRGRLVSGAAKNNVALKPADEPANDSPSAPKKGDRKKFPNGKTGVWDGVGWELVGG